MFIGCDPPTCQDKDTWSKYNFEAAFVEVAPSERLSGLLYVIIFNLGLPSPIIQASECLQEIASFTIFSPHCNR
jgi:hypothetical protein